MGFHRLKPMVKDLTHDETRQTIDVLHPDDSVWGVLLYSKARIALGVLHGRSPYIVDR